MKYTIKQIKDSLPAEKKHADGIWTTIFLRPLSIPFAWAALRLNMSANAVTWFSVIPALAGGILLSVPGFWLSFTGIILLNLFAVLDCVDGNVARVTNTQGPWGGWTDAVAGFIAYTAVFLGTGVYIYLRSGWWPILLVTAITSSGNLLARVAYQKYRTFEPEEAANSVSFEVMLAENVGITGFLMPGLLLCHIIGGMIWIVWFNFLFYVGGALVTIIKLARKSTAAG